MTAITFDTYKFIRVLKEASFNEQQAAGISTAFQGAQNESDVATKTDIELLRAEMREISGKVDSTRWIMLILVIAVIAPQLKGFF